MRLASFTARHPGPVSLDFDIEDIAWVLEKLAAHAFERNELRQCNILINTAQLLREVVPKGAEPVVGRG